jgi:3-phytase
LAKEDDLFERGEGSGRLSPVVAILTGLSGFLLVAFVGLLIAVCSRGSDASPGAADAPVTPASTATPRTSTSATATPAGVSATAEAAAGPVDRVTASVETEPVAGSGDAADDPAIWVHPTDPSQSVIIGTDKANGGLAVYSLDGRQLQYLNTGEVNNVDLRYDFPLGNERVALLIASDRSNNTVAVFRLNAGTRQLSPVTARNNRSGLDVYGACMYRSASSGAYYAFVTEEGGGGVEQYEIRPDGDGVSLNRVRTLSLGDQSEGCVADDLTGALYIAEEDEGIWRYGAEPSAGSERRRIDSTSGSGHLDADVEGLSIFYAGPTEGYLIASSQGNDSYVIYDRATNAYVGTFRVQDGAIDAINDTDGLDVTNRALGPAFPNGLFVAQDGSNRDGSREGRQNFKLVPWETIAGFFQPPLTLHTQPP